jgi:hypothetical protein
MNKEVTRLSKLIKKHQGTLHNIQENCTHPKETLVYQNKSDTGNYDPSCDSYWAEYKCYECGKFWIGEQREFEGITFGSGEHQILLRKEGQ